MPWDEPRGKAKASAATERLLNEEIKVFIQSEKLKNWRGTSMGDVQDIINTLNNIAKASQVIPNERYCIKSVKPEAKYIVIRCS